MSPVQDAYGGAAAQFLGDPASPGSLPATGMPLLDLAIFALVLLALGVTAWLVSRR